MFKVPDWEEDVPKCNINLNKSADNIKKQKKIDVKPMLPKKVAKVNIPVAKQELKVLTQPKGTKRLYDGQTINNMKNKCNENNGINVSDVDTDKLDEVLLNAKKKIFYEPMQRDDVEHVLFNDTKAKNITETAVKLSLNGKQLSKEIGKNVQKNKKEKNYVGVPERENERFPKSFRVQSNNDVENNFVVHGSPPVNKKKEKLRGMLQMNTTRNSINVTGNKLRERMLERLKAAQFRYINEKLYTSSGTEAKELFQSDPVAFHTYHQGYQQQLKKWPVNPLDVIIKRIQKLPKTHIIADMGCGEGALSKRIPHKVRSFDLVSTTPEVEICDMAHTPLLKESVDVAVYCLALMGTELTQYLVEANRVLKMGGHLLIAEVESRFDDVDAFSKEVMRLGFKLKNLDKQHKVFFFMEFIKIRDSPAKKNRLPVLAMKPCLYKRR